MKQLGKQSLEYLNNELQGIVQNNRVNNLKMFVLSDAKSKLSVTLQPMHETLDMYHGLHPNFNDRLLRLFLSRLHDNTDTEFWMNVRKIQNEDIKLMNLILPSDHCTESFLSSIHANSSLKDELEISLLGKAILHSASHFGYRFKCKDKVIYDLIKQYLIDSKLPRLIFWDIVENERIIKIYGLWPEDQIIPLTSKFNVKLSDDEFWIEHHDDLNANGNQLRQLLMFQGDWEKHFKLLSSEVYYSGVMPCVRKIDYEINPLLQGRVQYLIFHVMRTTFATVDTFDNAHIMIHPFFHTEEARKHLDNLESFDQAEDILQDMYLYSEDEKVGEEGYDEASIRNINYYLFQSLNTHTVAISVNLITSDGYLIAAKRGKLSIDAGEYYCSANGQTEFMDEHVEFYRKSVYEDMPTMDFQSKYRIDLTNEAQRECIAELGTAAFDVNWKYYGVSYLSIRRQTDPDKKDLSPYRRMHFNVMVSNELKNTFKEVDRNHKHATERFENESLVGFKIYVYNNVFDAFIKGALSVFNLLNTNKSRIFLFLIIVSILIGKQSWTILDWSTYYDIVLIIVFILLSIVKFYKNLKIIMRMNINFYFLWNYTKDNQLSLGKLLRGILKKEKAHAIFSLMYGLHFISIAQTDE